MFGLQFINSRGEAVWLDMNLKVSKQDVRKTRRSEGSRTGTWLQFYLRVRYYPEHGARELLQTATVKQLYLQV